MFQTYLTDIAYVKLVNQLFFACDKMRGFGDHHWCKWFFMRTNARLFKIILTAKISHSEILHTIDILVGYSFRSPRSGLQI